MNRKILFRGQTRRFGEKVDMRGAPIPGEWVYGGIFQGTGDYSIIYGSESPQSNDIKKYTVYTDTVGQYTGITDANGRMVFDGDILRVRSTGKFMKVSIGEYQPPILEDYLEWRRLPDTTQMVGIYGEFEDGEQVFLFNGMKADIVGNIYDTPIVSGDDW